MKTLGEGVDSVPLKKGALICFEEIQQKML